MMIRWLDRYFPEFTQVSHSEKWLWLYWKRPHFRMIFTRNNPMKNVHMINHCQ
ncbi:hypothetical protein M1K46_22710 [Fictibacillus sp. WQ 8-8]|nr:hypothetical protein [Fictibacillus sp. WQ 8-8]MCQ6268400.1 hypothetical protein [Fictibacillus sp. WQ 8-8]